MDRGERDALTRIEQIRKADLTIEVVDADGKPLKDAIVKVQMQRHAFGFGTAVNAMVLGAAENDFPITRKRRAGVSWQDAQKYREIVKSYFNRVTFEGELHPQMWKLLAGEHPVWKHQYEVLTQQTVPWLQANIISVRGHYIGWGAMGFLGKRSLETQGRVMAIESASRFRNVVGSRDRFDIGFSALAR